MEVSKIKLEVYDLLGTIVPGLLTIALALIMVCGWSRAFLLMGHLTGTILTAALLGAFAVGQIIQEAADRLVKAIKGPRFLKAGRDSFWNSSEMALVREKIDRESGLQMDSVDTAYDFCLTCIEGRFSKRDTFVAISDLARSLWLLSLLAVLPTIQASVFPPANFRRGLLACCGVLSAAIFALLAWSRMVRFRLLSDLTVFRVYLAVDNRRSSPSTESQTDDEE